MKKMSLLSMAFLTSFTLTAYSQDQDFHTLNSTSSSETATPAAVQPSQPVVSSSKPLPVYTAPNRAFSVEYPFPHPDIQDSVGTIVRDSQGNPQRVVQFVEFSVNKGYLMEGFEFMDWIPIPNQSRQQNRARDMEGTRGMLKVQEQKLELVPVNAQASPQCHSLTVNGHWAYQCRELVYFMGPTAQFTFVFTMIDFGDALAFAYGSSDTHSRFIHSIQKL